MDFIKKLFRPRVWSCTDVQVRRRFAFWPRRVNVCLDTDRYPGEVFIQNRKYEVWVWLAPYLLVWKPKYKIIAKRGFRFYDQGQACGFIDLEHEAIRVGQNGVVIGRGVPRS